MKKKHFISLLAVMGYAGVTLAAEVFPHSSTGVWNQYYNDFDLLSGYFYYNHGATEDFKWTIGNYAESSVKGSVYVQSDGIYASWNDLSLDNGQYTPQDSDKNLGLGPFFYTSYTYWIADLVYNNRRYVLSDVFESHQCNLTHADLIDANPVKIHLGSVEDKLYNFNMVMPASMKCQATLSDMGPAFNSFHYNRRARYDFGWTVVNNAPDTVIGSFDTSSNTLGIDTDQLYASWNNISLESNQTTPYNPNNNIGLGPYFGQGNFWIVNVKYKGKKYHAAGTCNIEASDLGSITHVYVRGDNNGLNDILIGRPTNWCKPIPFVYIAPASAE